MKLNLTEQLRLEEAATPGNWDWRMFAPNMPLSGHVPGPDHRPNAEFICAARNNYRRVINIALAAVRRDEQEKKIAAFPVADEGLPEFKALVEKNLELSNAVRKLLADVEVGE